MAVEIGRAVVDQLTDAGVPVRVVRSSPEIQANWMRAYKAIPVNRKAYAATPPGLIDPKTRQPWTEAGFHRNIEWWAENRTKVNSVWSKWIIG